MMSTGRCIKAGSTSIENNNFSKELIIMIYEKCYTFSNTPSGFELFADSKSMGLKSVASESYVNRANAKSINEDAIIDIFCPQLNTFDIDNRFSSASLIKGDSANSMMTLLNVHSKEQDDNNIKLKNLTVKALVYFKAKQQ